MSPASVVAWMLAGSVVYIGYCVVRVVVKSRRKLPEPAAAAKRYARPDALP